MNQGQGDKAKPPQKQKALVLKQRKQLQQKKLDKKKRSKLTATALNEFKEKTKNRPSDFTARI